MVGIFYTTAGTRKFLPIILGIALVKYILAPQPAYRLREVELLHNMLLLSSAASTTGCS